jgi:hypothetical protein
MRCRVYFVSQQEKEFPVLFLHLFSYSDGLSFITGGEADSLFFFLVFFFSLADFGKDEEKRRERAFISLLPVGLGEKELESQLALAKLSVPF